LPRFRGKSTLCGIEESGTGRALVMELVPGQTLKGPLRLPDALRVAAVSGRSMLPTLWSQLWTSSWRNRNTEAVFRPRGELR
jgi:hypothetical protein